jgi:flagellin-like hook-associated protein FlgL
VIGKLENSSSFNVGSSLLAQRALRTNTLAFNQSMNRLGSGLRINSGKDDPAGLIAGESLRATLAALDAETNANVRASNIATTADGALGEISGLLGEAKRLVHANANEAGLSAEEKAANQMQIDSIVSTVDRLANTTSFGGQKLLNGSATIAASGKSLAINSVTSTSIGKTTESSVDYSLGDKKSGGALAGAGGSLAGKVIDQAINDISTQRATIGSFDKHTLQTRIATIETSREQMLSAISTIRDADYAMEVSRRARFDLLKSSSMLMLGKANRNTPISTFSILA